MSSQRFIDIQRLETMFLYYQQHGVCAVGKHPWDAFEHIERLEHICQIALASGGVGES